MPPAGLEPATSGLGCPCSIQLSYGGARARNNARDGTVRQATGTDFNQRVTCYNTLRHLGSQVIFLEYVGENHGLATPANQRASRLNWRYRASTPS